MGDNQQLYIFDIDSALDKLENEENENQELQNNEITKQQQQKQSNQEYIKEENGNLSTTSIINYEESSIDKKGKF